MLVLSACLGAAASVAVLVGVVGARRAIGGTTLTVAWRAAAVCSMSWVVSNLAGVEPALLPTGWRDQLWYATAVLSLVPLIAVLGARRPGSGAWTAFVLVPLVVVLELPAWSQWRPDGPPDRLLLEPPAVMGLAVALVMGAGNYFGTRFTRAVGLYALAIVSLVVPVASGDAKVSPETWRLMGSMSLLAATFAARGRAAAPPGATGWDRAWLDFRDSFGIVWAKRVMDRANEAARGERWPVRLDISGFVPATDVSDRLDAERAASRIDHWMRLLLRRFVDPAWIAERVGLGASSGECEPASDSARR